MAAQFRRLAVAAISLAIAGVLYWGLALHLRSGADGGRIKFGVEARHRLCDLGGAAVDAHGEAVAAASICITRTDELAAVNAICASADAYGRYGFAGLKNDRYQLVATAGSISGVADADLTRCGKQATVDIQLHASTATLIGVVRDIEGNRIANSQVTVIGAPPRSQLRLTVLTELNGAFAVPLPPGQVSIEVRADSYATARVPVVVPANDVVITLIPESLISGKVVASDSKSPLAGITVRAVPSGMLTEIFESPVATDSEGRFSIRGLEPGQYRLIAEDEEWRSLDIVIVSVELGRRTEDQLVEVTKGVPLRARVSVVSSNEPCPSGYVALTDDSTPVQLPTLNSLPPIRPAAPNKTALNLNSAIQDNGMVEFNGLPPGKYTAYVHCFGYHPAGAPPSVVVGAHESIDIQEWKIAPASRVVLLVRDESGQPIEDAQVGLLNADNAMMTALHLEKGEYEILAVPPGSYRAISRSAMASDNRAPIQLTVPETAETVTATLILAGDSSISVKARNRDKVGVGGLQVYASLVQGEAVTDSVGGGNTIPASELGNGAYLIRPLTAGRYRVSVGDGRNPPQSQEIDLARGAKRDLEIEINFSEKITGTVVDDNGNPLHGVTVSIRHEAALPTWPLSTYQKVLKGTATLTDAQGRFVIDGLYSSGAYTVTVEKAGALAAKRTDVTAGSHVEFSLAAPLTVYGRIVDESNRPAGDVFVQITNEETGVTQTGEVTVMTGAWSFKNVTPGEVTVTARDSTGRMATRSLKVNSQSSHDAIVLKLQSGADENNRSL